MRIDDLNIRLIKTMRRKLADVRKETDAVTARLKPEHVARIAGVKEISSRHYSGGWPPRLSALSEPLNTPWITWRANWTL